MANKVNAVVFTCFCWCISTIIHAQGIGIGTTSPHSSAQLDVSSTSRGLLIPRLTKAQRIAIVLPADGLLVFQTGPDSVGFYYRFGDAWTWLQNATGPGSGWSTTGNSGMIFGTNYLGTRDNSPLLFGLNGAHAGGMGVRNNISLGRGSGFSTYGSTGTNNIAFGDSAMYGNTTGKANIAIGTQALKSNLGGFNNTAIGDSALTFNTSGFNNLAVGALSGYQNVTGSFNTFLGHMSGANNKRGNANVAVGQAALYYDTSGISNVAIGVGALGYNLARNGNTAVGYQSLLYNAYPTSPLLPNQGQHNTAVGESTMLNNLRGSGSVAIGFRALYSDTAADGTIAIGRNALYFNKGRKGNLAIGDSSLYHNTIGSFYADDAVNNLAIGEKALFNNTKGMENFAIGNNALKTNSSGRQNIAIGRSALESNSIANGSIAIGHEAMQYVTGSTLGLANWNIAIGNRSLRGSTNPSNNTGVHNIAMGYRALAENTSGESNLAIGVLSQVDNRTGSQNVSLGSFSLSGINSQSGNANVAIGFNALSKLVNNDNNTGIGRNSGAAVNGSRNTMIGANQPSYENDAGFIRNIDGSVFIGYNAGTQEVSSNKLYIENSDANKEQSLIYGDFAADSLLLNAKTINRNLFALRGAGANTGIELGYSVFLKETNAGRIGYALATSNTIDFYGGGTSTSNRAIKFWAEGGSTFTGSVRLAGSGGTTGIYLGQDVAGKEGNAGRIGYALFTQDAVDFVGGGTGTNNRQIRFWAEGGSRFTGKVIPDADNAFSLGESGRRWSQVWSATGTIQTSDANLKTNIDVSPYGLNEVMQLTPVQYNWKESPNGTKEVGLLAQDVLKLIPEAVVVPEDGSAMGMKYSELVPVLIKAIQEQQQQIVEQKRSLQNQEMQINELKKIIRNISK